MSEVIRKVASVLDLPEKLREGFDPARPVTVSQDVAETPQKRSAELMERVEKARSDPRFRPFKSGDEVVEWVRWVRDAEGPTPDRWRRWK